MNQQVTLTAFINISPKGNSSVEFVEKSKITKIRLIKISLLYAAKIAFLLASEPIEITQAYKNLIEEIIQPAEWSASGKITERLSEIALALQEEDIEPSAVLGGERFSISLIEGGEFDFVNTELPNPGFVANLPISVIFLFDATAKQLSKGMIKIFESQFQIITREIFKSDLVEINDLKKFNIAITNALNFKDEEIDH